MVTLGGVGESGERLQLHAGGVALDSKRGAWDCVKTRVLEVLKSRLACVMGMRV